MYQHRRLEAAAAALGLGAADGRRCRIVFLELGEYVVCLYLDGVRQDAALQSIGVSWASESA